MKYLFLSLLITCNIAIAQQRPQGPLVTVTGNLDPKFSIDVRPEDLKAVAEGLKGLKNLEPVAININDLMSDGDVVAISEASQAVADALINAAKNLIDLRVLVYRLYALQSLSMTQDHTKALQDAYNVKFKADFNSLVSGLVIVDKLEVANKNCLSELCVIQIANAAKELVGFAHGIRNGFKVGYMYSLQNNLIKAAVSEVNKQMNLMDSNSDYSVLVHSALVPFIEATYVRNYDVGAGLADIISVENSEKSKLSVKSYSFSAKAELSRIQEFAEASIGEIVSDPTPRRAKVSAILADREVKRLAAEAEALKLKLAAEKAARFDAVLSNFSLETFSALKTEDISGFNNYWNVPEKITQLVQILKNSTLGSCRWVKVDGYFYYGKVIYADEKRELSKLKSLDTGYFDLNWTNPYYRDADSEMVFQVIGAFQFDRVSVDVIMNKLPEILSLAKSGACDRISRETMDESKARVDAVLDSIEKKASPKTFVDAVYSLKPQDLLVFSDEEMGAVLQFISKQPPKTFGACNTAFTSEVSYRQLHLRNFIDNINRGLCK